jgi:hypothetical protein
MNTQAQDTLCPQCGQHDCTCQSDWANSINDEVVKLARSNTPDFTVQNEGTIYLLRPNTPAAQSWIAENLPPDRMTFGDAIAVEHRYICDIIDGIRAAGLEVR